MRDPSRFVFAIARADGRRLRVLGTGFLARDRSVVTSAEVLAGVDEDVDLVAVVRQPHVGDYPTLDSGAVDATPVTRGRVDVRTGLAVLELPHDPVSKPSFKWGGPEQVPPGSVVTCLGFLLSTRGPALLTSRTASVAAMYLSGGGDRLLGHLVLDHRSRPEERGGPVFAAGTDKLIGVVVGAGTWRGGDGGPEPLFHDLDVTEVVAADAVVELLA